MCSSTAGRSQTRKLQCCNGQAEHTGAKSAEDMLVTVAADSQRSYEWFSDRGRLTMNRLTREAMYTFFDLIPEAGNTFREILFCIHDVRVGQIKYLRRISREFKSRGPEEPMLAAVPITPSGLWPSFPRKIPAGLLL